MKDVRNDIFDEITLRPQTRRWITSLEKRFVLEDFHLRLLALAGAAWDRAVEARQEIADQGLTFVDRFGQTKLSPCVSIEAQSMVNFARLLREVGLDLEKTDLPQPPRPGGYK